MLGRNIVLATFIFCFGIHWATSSNPQQRAQEPSSKLGKTAQREKTEELIGQLTNKNDDISLGALKSLEKIGLDAIDELLVASAKGDPETREMVAVVLGKLRHSALREKKKDVGDAIENVLLEALSDPNHRVVNGAAAALTFTEPRAKKAIPKLAAILEMPKSETDTTDLAWAAAISGVKRFGTDASSTVAVMLRVLADKKNSPNRRSAVCEALAAVGPKDVRVPDALRRVLKDDDEELGVRHAAASGLAKVGTAAQSAVSDIVAVVSKTSAKKTDALYSAFRKTLTLSLAELKLSSSEIDVLSEIISDPGEHPSVRLAALNALRCEGADARRACRRLAETLMVLEPDSPIAMAIVQALGRFGQAAIDTGPALRQTLLRSKYIPLNDAIKGSLSLIDPPKSKVR